MDKRQFLKLSTGVSLGFILPNGVNAANTLQVLKSDMRWPSYSNSVVIDGLSAAFDYGVESFDNNVLAIFKQSGISALNATIPSPGDDHATTLSKIESTLALIKRYPSHFRLVTKASDVLLAKKQQQIGIIMGFQSTEMFADDLNQIDFFARNGVRYMQLSYNGASQFGSGGLVKNDKGLKVLGQEALQRMEKNKVLVDLSHAGQKTVAQAIKESTRPLTISHTGCNGVYRHPRNNDDAELKAVADKGGVVGIYLMPFLEGGDSELKAEALLRHIDYAVNLCGEDHISIGSDQGVVPVNDGSAYREAIRQEVKRRIAAGISAPGETPNRPPFIAELNSEKRMELIAWHLSKRGYRCSQIEKILGLNLLQLYRAVW
jgi:membrane dipeptidase|tara:strand:+ start:17045 stop:18169 length:1125 start_codon:yes stop_codon:yes gene_type:complete